MKKIKYVLISLIMYISLSTYAFATGVSISGNTSVTRGNKVTVTATVASDSPIVSIEGSFICKGPGVSEGVDMVFDDSSNSLKNKNYSITIKPTISGIVTCSTIGVRLTNMSDGSWQTLGDKTLTIEVKDPVVVPPKTYSSNNNLEMLSINNYPLSPEFNKDTLEYTVEVPNDTSKITINATKEDNTAKIDGIGEKEVAEGTNKFEVKVEAENGNTKTYTIMVIVKELDPITVTIDSKTYTIIRKTGLLVEPSNYDKSTVTIGEEEVLCYKNKKTKDILIGLTDEKGISSYFTYNEKTQSYTKYQNILVNGTSLKLLTMPKEKIPKDYSKVSFDYDNNKIDGYQYIQKDVTYAADLQIKGSSFYLIYAINEESGKKGIYVYDKEENTIQRYNTDLVLYYQSSLDKTNLYLYISLFVVGILLVTLSIFLIKKSKNKQRR